MYKGRVFALEEHVERLINSCRALMFEDIPEADNIKNAVIPPPPLPPIFYFLCSEEILAAVDTKSAVSLFSFFLYFFSIFLFFL